MFADGQPRFSCVCRAASWPGSRHRTCDVAAAAAAHAATASLLQAPPAAPGSGH